MSGRHQHRPRARIKADHALAAVMVLYLLAGIWGMWWLLSTILRSSGRG
ncbi:hypothetical protein [Arthrobacter russicus]|uniref:Uncharacterized protein n=1 Tax=Arthrobacter russicus TaxID=172040 RepID=A0ABU1JE27_9MICC|nr:hypothetical protein [Arthrobacter russicus]MDR6270630.1 hypothetical protein [Arthrobacter russicus]